MVGYFRCFDTGFFSFWEILLRMDLSHGNAFQTYQLDLRKVENKEIQNTKGAQKQCSEMGNSSPVLIFAGSHKNLSPED